MQTIKLLLVFFILTINLARVHASYSEINYVMTPELKSNRVHLKMEVEIRGEFDDNMVVDLPGKWGGVDYSDQIKNVRLNHFKKHFKKLDNDRNQILITRPGKKRLVLTYEVHQKEGDPSNVHNAIIRDDLFHSPGYGIFALPEDVPDKIKMSIRWRDIRSDWRVICSHGDDFKYYFEELPVSDLLHSLYIAAYQPRIHQTLNVGGSNYVFFYGNFDFDEKELDETLKKIMGTQRVFFDEKSEIFYLASIIEGDNPNSWGGTGLKNSFAAFIPKNMTKKEIERLFAHEHLHRWIGGIIRYSRDKLDYWWSEGFTDYYGMLISFRSRSLNVDEFIAESNKFLHKYYSSPVVNEPNSRIKKDFWNNHDVEKLPYYRGFVFAHYLNHLIKKHTDSKASLDNVMRRLYRDAKNFNKPFSTEHFARIVKEYVPGGIEKELEDFIEKGKTISLSEMARTEPLRMKQVKKGIYYLGFDRGFFKKNHIIRNIDVKSNAYKVGLRNGDKIVSWDIWWEDTDKMVTLKTKDKSFKFKPEHYEKKHYVWQFESGLDYEQQRELARFFRD